ncbi:hypothetical protein [Nitratireductor indicus]|uniref:hypothetical protein n=1 Tax=Nitratireductor indicus TaxID=721133 RepID=UPI002875309F|nr:hypothetical protein [Nitratireductor indicus]MDS1136287.1 hypothetical protein [Nitratireductor indicus]
MSNQALVLTAIHAAGLVAALVATWSSSIRLWQAALMAAAFMSAGWLVPWPFGSLPEGYVAWLAISLAISVPAALVVGRILGIGLWSASKIVLACGAGMLVAGAAIVPLVR